MGVGRLLPVAATLAATLVACSKTPLAPQQVTAFYTNQSSHFNTKAPGTAIITWLSPGTIRDQHTQTTPGGAFTWYGPGFRTDTVRPNQVVCEHFEAPDNQIAVEYTIVYPGGVGIGYASRSGEPITWRADVSWGFTGDAVGPAGSSDGFSGIVQGC